MKIALESDQYYRFYADGGSYRYTFNGKETDAESDLQDYGMRIYNARLGKFLSVDPITASYPMLTPYQFASNTPIMAADLDGLEADVKIGMHACAGTYDRWGVFVPALAVANVNTGESPNAGSLSNERVAQRQDPNGPVHTGYNQFYINYNYFATPSFDGGSHFAGIFHPSSVGTFYPLNIHDVNPEDSKWKFTHIGLDGIGLIPGVGDIIADPLNAALYASEGDFANAGISAAAMIPVYGTGVIATKWGVRGLREMAPAGYRYLDYNQARNASLNWLVQRGFRAETKTLGKFGYTNKVGIGMKNLNEPIGFRVEYTSLHGAHINVFAGNKQKATFLFNATESTTRKIQTRFH